MAQESSNRVPLTRRTALKSLAAAGAATTGLGASSVNAVQRGTALHEPDSAQLPVEVSRRMNDEIPALLSPEEDTRVNNDSLLWYWGSRWDPDKGARRHRFLVSGQGTCYENWDPVHNESGQELVDTGFTDHELSVQRKSGDVNIVAPYKEEMVGVANPGDLTAALESDSEVDTSEFATSVFEQQKNGLESIDLERRVSDLSSNYQTDVEPTLMDFAGVGAELIAFAYAPVGTALTLASLAPIVEAALSTGSEQDIDPGDGFSWPPDPGIPTSETGAVSQLFAAFDVMVPESSAGGELAIKTSFKIGHGDAVETSWKVTLDGGGEPDVGQCVDSRDVVRREMSIWADLDVDASATPHHATRPNAGIQQPTARRAYAVDGEIPFEPAQELWRNRWHVDKVGEGHCSPLQESELDGAVEKITSPGRWRVVHHARNQSGLSAIDEATIFVTEDESHEVLPLDSSNAVDPTELTLPQGADEYTEV